MPEISVIIPTYNRCRVLKRALESVFDQEGSSFEVVVVDDGSTDNTESWISQEFPEVRYFSQENRGPSAARNRGLKEARGEWIAFLDSDDEWKPGKLGAQLEFFAENPECGIAQTEEIWVRNGTRVNPMNKHKKKGGRIFEHCLELCRVSPSAVMIHRRIFESVGLFDEAFPACEDYELWLRIAAREPIGLIDKPYVIKYGGHADQRSREFPAMDRFRMAALVKILREGALSDADEKNAREMLRVKAEIYRLGAAKRQKEDEIRKIETLLREIEQNKPLSSDYRAWLDSSAVPA